MADFEIPRHSVIQYVRSKKRVPYGVLVAVKNSDGFCTFGYSLCNKKDRFNKRMALKIALGRANITNPVEAPDVPHDVRKMIPAFFERCKKYYKPNHELATELL